MITSLWIVSAMFALPASVDDLPLAPRPLVVDPAFEKVMNDIYGMMEEEDADTKFPSKEAFYQFTKEKTQPLYKTMGKIEYFGQACLFTAKQAIDVGRGWPHGMLALFIFGEVYAETKNEMPVFMYQSLGPFITHRDVNYRDFFFREILDHALEAEDLEAIKRLLGEGWAKEDYTYNGLIDYVYAKDAFEGWKLWHNLIGTSEADQHAVLEKLQVLYIPYKRGFKDEERWASSYEWEEKDYRPEMAASLELLREMVSDGGLPEKLFVAAILEAAPVFRTGDLVEKLQEVDHPFVQIRMRYLESE